MLVPKPKKALRSPGTHSLGRNVVVVVMRGTCSCCGGCSSRCFQCGNDRRAAGHPSEDAALCHHHRQCGAVEFGEVGSAAVLDHQAIEAPVVGLAHGGVHAHLRSHATDQQLVDAT